MTLTLKTADYAKSDGRIYAITDNPEDIDSHTLLREEATADAPDKFTPCIVVTTAREAFEAAWELAYEIKGDTVPSKQAYIYRDGLPFLYTVNTYGYAHEPEGSILDHGEHRLLDPPTSEPEPWELSTFCYANGDIYKRSHTLGENHWRRPGYKTVYYRDALAKLNPKPVTIEGVDE